MVVLPKTSRGVVGSMPEFPGVAMTAIWKCLFPVVFRMGQVEIGKGGCVKGFTKTTAESRIEKSRVYKTVAGIVPTANRSGGSVKEG